MASFVILFMLTAASIYAAIMYGNESIMLLVYLEAALFLIAFFNLLLFRRKVKVTLEIPVGIAESGGEGMVKLSVNNMANLAISRMKVKIEVRDLATGKKRSAWMRLPAMASGETEFIKSIRFVGTGTYVLRLKKVKIFDMTGLFYCVQKEECPAKLLVMPELFDMPVQVTTATKNFYGEADVYDEYNPGYDNNEIFQIRAYQKGDRVQSIHWKLSAKQEEIMIKERALPKVCPVVLFLDYRPKGVGKRVMRRIGFVDAVSCISYSLVERGCPHYVVWYDENNMDVIRVRVDDEESLFFFIGTIMKVNWVNPSENLVDRYEEKYHSEPYLWRFSVDEKMQFKKGDELLAVFSSKNLQKSLSQIELTL